MVQAHTSPAHYFSEVARTRALFTDAAGSEAVAAVLGALVDFMSTMRHRQPDTAGTSLVLTRLAAQGAMRSADLATALRLDQSTVSRHVAALEAEGLVERLPVPEDRRAHRVQLTEQGATAAHEQVREKVARFERVLASWPREDIQTFAQLLERFARGLVDERPTA